MFISPRILSGRPTETEFREVVQFNQLELDCAIAQDALPAPEFRWEKDGEVVSPNEQFRILNNGSKLFIRQVTGDLAGRYTCTVSNKAGTDYRNYLVTVHHPPVFQARGLVHRPSGYVLLCSRNFREFYSGTNPV